MHRRGLLPRWSTLTMVTFVAMSGGSVGAGSLTPAQKCEVAKMKAVAKKTAAELACNEKGVVKGTVDPTCIPKARGAFTAAIQKAEAKGGCVDAGNGPAIESQVDAFVTKAVDCIMAHCG
jgi:hypothetical protein